jgi:hypothetical protein
MTNPILLTPVWAHLLERRGANLRRWIEWKVSLLRYAVQSAWAGRWGRNCDGCLFWLSGFFGFATRKHGRS